MYYYLYLATTISHLHRSSLIKHTQSLTLTLFLSEHHHFSASWKLLLRSTESISKNTMKPTSFTSRKLLLLLLISSLGLIFVFLLSSFSTTTIASLLLIPKTAHAHAHAHGDDIVVNIDEGGLSQMNSVLEKGLKDENLMGVEVEEEEEDCGDQGDEEEKCLKRRMISEAHLDYIYTQHQHP